MKTFMYKSNALWTVNLSGCGSVRVVISPTKQTDDKRITFKALMELALLYIQAIQCYTQLINSSALLIGLFTTYSYKDLLYTCTKPCK